MSLAVPASAQDYDLSRVPSSAQWVIRADVERFLKTDLGAFALSEADRPENTDKLAVLENLTGIDIRRDVRSFTLYGSEFGPRNAVAVIEGRLDRDKLLPLLRSGRPVEEVQVGDLTVYKWRDAADPNNATKAGAFLRDDLVIIAGDVDSLEGAIAALEGQGDTMTVAPAGSISAPWLSVLVARIPVARRTGIPEAVAAKIKSARLQVGETSGEYRSDLTVATVDAQSAADVAEVVQGLLAVLSLCQGAERHGSPVISAEALAILRDITASSQGDAATISLRTPSKKMLDLVNWALAHRHAKAERRMRMQVAPAAPEQAPAPQESEE
jgi:hypothetical protein